MRNKNVRLLLNLLITLVVISVALAGYVNWQKNHFSCEAQITLVTDRGTEDLIMHFRFSGDTGQYESKGKYVTASGREIPTSNKIDFTFWRDGDALVMISDETNAIPKTAGSVYPYTPDFFYSRERGLRWKLTMENAAGYLFSYDGTPAFYCAITRK
ncbi:hypothetical protein [[Enterobacter] lignolyticus]|uniref:Uncharacterized protein n=1 Tax=[Enterobacter] lignolyticus TaxID=1334193 RepID=A0A806X9M3_9ENTR|nr:hypothetical protein [[Enterobacter] lignolyticus]ALR78604.1 hypothetical protein AO703_20675 [[Enterobacter] lignolyticus]